MTVFPPRSASVLLAEFGERWVAYDLADGTRHHLDAATGQVLAACGTGADRGSFTARQANATGLPGDTVSAKIDSILDEFERLGLTGATTPVPLPDEPTGAPTSSDGTPLVGPHHRVLDLTIRFRGIQQDLLDEIDDYLGTARPDDEHPEPEGPAAGRMLFFDVHRHPDGGVDLVTDETASHDATGTLLRRLVTVTGDQAIRTRGCTVLHAGGVRSPSGRTVLLPAPSGNGKSTLTAALVANRWDYLSDDIIGIDDGGHVLGHPKRIGLGPISRKVVGLDHSPDRTEDVEVLHTHVRRVVDTGAPPAVLLFPRYRPGAACTVEELEPSDVVDALITNSLNLAVMGDRGLQSLCDLANRVQAFRLVHGDAIEAAEVISGLVDDVDPTEPGPDQPT